MIAHSFVNELRQVLKDVLYGLQTLQDCRCGTLSTITNKQYECLAELWAEQRIIEWLTQNGCGNYTFVSEHSINAEVRENIIPSLVPFIVIDPIDGTHLYKLGGRNFCVNVHIVHSLDRRDAFIASADHNDVFWNSDIEIGQPGTNFEIISNRRLNSSQHGILGKYGSYSVKVVTGGSNRIVEAITRRSNILIVNTGQRSCGALWDLSAGIDVLRSQGYSVREICKNQELEMFQVLYPSFCAFKGVDAAMVADLIESFQLQIPCSGNKD